MWEPQKQLLPRPLQVFHFTHDPRLKRVLGLMTLDGAAAENSDLALDDAWHFAEAFHFFILAQKCLCQDQNEDALRVCLHLQDFGDVINPLTIYSLLALASLRCQYFKQCSLVTKVLVE